jgi:adenylosuccinate lyase
MRVFPERMRRNLDLTKGLVFSGQLLLDLVEAGAPRDEGYQWVQSHAMEAWETDTSFRERVGNDPRIAKYLNPAGIARAFDLDRQLHAVDDIFQRVFAADAPAKTHTAARSKS